jgi:crotonobetainyl-CoA:carnitine CoA-transferase CaiB-like acyl-CoA transferase
LLEAVGIVVGEVKGYAEVVADPQVEANGSLLRVPVGEGEAAFVRPPYSIGGQRFPTRYSPAPSVGQHTVEVLRELGYEPGQIDALLGSGAAAVSAAH